MMSNGNHCKTVSAIGTGNMGSALTEALLSAGVAVTVWNRTVSKAQRLVQLGAILADSPAEAVRNSDTIAELKGLRDEAGRIGLKSTVQVLETALASP